MASEREACGLGALLPVSCRGRAESFARRLHTRLRSLGGGSTELLGGSADEDEDALDSGGGLDSGGWGGVRNGEGGGGGVDGEEDEEEEGGGLGVRASVGASGGGGCGAEGGCGSTKYRSTDRDASGGVTVQQPLPHSSSSLPGGPSPSPSTGTSPPFSSSPRPRLDSGLESLGSPTSGTPPRPGSNGSESGFAGVSSPSNGYFSPPNDQGFSSGRWNASPSPEIDHRSHHSRSPYQRPPRRRRDIKWPPSAPQQEAVETGEAALPNFLECFPQTGVESPPETSWSASSMSPENGASGGSGSRYQGAAGGADDVDGNFAAETYWHHYAYSRHHHHARSPATPPLQSPDMLPRNSKGILSPTSYTPPCSPVSPEEAAAACAVHGSYSPSSALKSPISEINEEEEEAYKGTEPEYLPLREDSDEHLNGGEDSSSLESNGLPNSSSEDAAELEMRLSNGHSSEHVPVVQEQKDSSDLCDTSSGDQPDTYTAVSLLSFDVSRVTLSVSADSEDAKSEDEVAPLQRDSRSCLEKAEKVGEEEEGFSEDSMERDIQTLADTIYGKREGETESAEEGLENVESGDSEPKPKNENDADTHFQLAVGECSPVEGSYDEMELRKKFLDAESSDMDLKAVRIICEEMASRAKLLEGELVITGVTDADESKTEAKQEEEISVAVVDDESGKEKKEEVKGTEEDEEEIEERTPRVRRSTSLKTGKTPPGTPSRKKIVRFADVLGLDLADVRTFLDEIPHVPRSAFQDLAPEASLGPSASAALPHWSAPADWDLGMSPVARVARRPRRYHLTPMFPQPGAAADFIDRIRERCVCLESAMEEDAEDEDDDGTEFGVNGWSVLGTVRVRNLAFYKTVHARASADGWRSHADVPASYLPGSCDGFSDRFAFELRPGIPPSGGGPGAAPFPRRIPNGGRLEFAVRFQCQGSQYWDNNSGVNYVFSVEPCVNPTAAAQASEKEGDGRPPLTPAPVRSQAAFRYLSLPASETDWATFL